MGCQKLKSVYHAQHKSDETRNVEEVKTAPGMMVFDSESYSFIYRRCVLSVL